MSRLLPLAAFAAGLLAIAWIGLGYVGTNPIALAVTGLIAAFYLAGAFELRRFDGATAALARALAGLEAAPASLGAWLATLPPALQNPVRLRIEGERAGLPGPALAPYLAGLLVLLGMLGTFLGMIVTLNGTGAALGSATDVQAIRESLAAPVKGLGLAFGTSVAGVAASAMLGLLSALCRRDRLQAAQQLDARIATVLRPFSRAQRRDEAFVLLQRQADAMPALIDRLAAMTSEMARQAEALHARLGDEQARFHAQAEAGYAALAASVERSLKTSLADGARAAGAALQPVAEATMAGIARETAALQVRLEHGAQRQAESLADRLDASTREAAAQWHGTLAAQREAHAALAADLGTALDRFAGTFEQRAGALVDGISAELGATTGRIATTWNDALAEQRRAAERGAQETHATLAAAAAGFEQHAASLVRTLDASHAQQRGEAARADAERLAAWTDALGRMTAAQQHEWQQAGATTARQQQAICDTLAATASRISAEAGAHAERTIAEIARLMQAAAEAPRAAASVIGELRQQLSESMARDNTLLDERARLLATLATVLDAVNHTSTEQRGAIDALVSGASALLERSGTHFASQIESQGERLAEAATQVGSSAIEVASLGDAFGHAVQRFGETSEKLGAQLQRIEAALARSTARSDEQLAYYVAQAREVIDLSIGSQQQIVEDLQRLARERVALSGN